MRSILLSSFLLSSSLVSALDWNIPSTWRSTTTARGSTERINLAQDALNNIQSSYNPSIGEYGNLNYWPSANIVSALALKDVYAGTKNNQAIVTNALMTAWAQHDHFYKNIYNDDAMWWGTAAVYAYRAYGDTTLLSYATGNWDAVTPFQITTAQASSGTTPKKNFAFRTDCDSATMYGGVFWTTDPAGTDINAITTGLYMTLSAYLASITKDSKYTTASQAAAQFIYNHVYDKTRSIVLDTVEANDCSKKDYVFTYNSGKFIEGLSVLAQVTGNAQYSTWMQQTIQAAVKTSNWQGSDGIITEGQGEPQSSNDDGRGFKAIFIRGLTEARIRNSGNASLMAMVRAYVNVQYNALLDLSRSGSSYGVNWHGPYQGPYLHGQLAAIDVINAGISVNNS